MAGQEDGSAGGSNGRRQSDRDKIAEEIAHLLIDLSRQQTPGTSGGHQSTPPPPPHQQQQPPNLAQPFAPALASSPLPLPPQPPPPPVPLPPLPTPPPQPATVQQTPITAAQVRQQIEGELRDFVGAALLTTRFHDRHYRQASQVATVFGGIEHLREALVGLDAADWDVGGAIQQHDFDDEDRQNHSPPANPLPPSDHRNRGLDRDRASGGPNWDQSKLTLSIRTATSQWKHRDYRAVDPTFNADSPSPMEILRLNRWRHEELMRKAGPRLRSTGGYQGTGGDWWHPATARDIRKRFSKRIGQMPNSDPDYKGMARAHNEIFRDMYLPGEMTKVPERSAENVGSFINNRAADDKKTRNEDYIKRRTKLRSVFRKVAAKEKKRSNDTLEAGFSSTKEEWDAVKKETLVLQSDIDDEDGGDGGDGGDGDGDGGGGE